MADRPIFEVEGFDRASRDRFFLAVERPRLARGRELERLIDSRDPVAVLPLKGRP